jgi:hypothetical protein
MAGPALIISIVGDARKLNDALGGADRKVQAFGKSVDLGMVAKVGVAAGVVGIAANALFDMAKAAGEDRAEAAKLEAAITAAGAATGDYTAQVEAAIVAGQDRAFTDTQTREALQSLVTATGDVTGATALLSTAQDVARFAGVDLATAADAVAKAQAGNATQLGRLIPGLEKGATAQDTLANAQAAAAGQADAFAASTEGSMARGADAFAELGETVGSVLLPILDELLPAIVPVLQALGKLVTAVLPILVPLIKVLAKALGIVADVLVRVVNLVADLVGAFLRGIDVVRRFVDSLPDLSGLPFSIPGVTGATVPTGLGVSTMAASSARSGALGGGGGGVTVNIHGGDPTLVEAAVARALRGYTRRNGTLGLAGMTGRGGVPGS